MKHFRVIFSLIAIAGSTLMADAYAQAPRSTGSVTVDATHSAQNSGAGAISYAAETVSPEEVLIHIAPQYTTRSITVGGREMTSIGFAGGELTGSAGGPAEMKLVLPFLAPSRTPMSVEVVSQQVEVLSNTDLAPVPTESGSQGTPTLTYSVNGESYARSVKPQLYDVEAADVFRTAFSERLIVSPVQYDASTHRVTKVVDLVLRVRFQDAARMSRSESAPARTTELDFYKGIFVNGGVEQFYRSAVDVVTSSIKARPAFKGASALGGGQWLMVETTDEGIYKISAADLAGQGITGPIDANSVELFGVGGEQLDETVTGSNGEWIERPINVIADGSQLKELTFYARGTTIWKYYPKQDQTVDGLFHRVNPYATTGHYLLKIGGDRIGDGLRVASGADTVTAVPTPSNRVFTASVHEEEKAFELPNYGRELIEGPIPRSDVRTMQVGLTTPGYTGDSTTVRIGADALIPSERNVSHYGAVLVSMNGTYLDSIRMRTGNGIPGRTWDNSFSIGANVQTPLTVGLSFVSSNISSRAWLDWVEVMYRRTTDIGSSSIPFMVIDTKQAFQYSFTNASGGQVWDVTNSFAPRILASANGDGMPVTLQGQSGIMRRFMAVSAQSILSPRLSKTSEPSLRATLGQKGAQSIIITPQAFLDAANELKRLREQGGQATEPMSVAVVTIEDIYREFGYGARDLTAVRDFLSYTFRHTTSAGGTVPLYVTLIGSGHSDYLNRVTSVPNWMPAYELPESEYLGSYRQVVSEAYPDDGFFARLIPHTSSRILDLATGRISAHTSAEAMEYVNKVRTYELSSDEGDWRSVASFVADDHWYDNSENPEDPIQHLADTEDEIAQLPDRLFVSKIYEAAYPSIYTSSGPKKPSVERAIIDAMNNGTVLLSFVGHGNPHVWAHENILNVPSTINRFNNLSRLTYGTTATCDFSAYDNYDEVSGGVQMLLKPDGGAIGLLGTSRSVTGGESLVTAFYRALLDIDCQSGYGTASVGTALIAGKIASSLQNLAHYYLLGDPSQRLLVPRLYVAFDSLNGRPFDGAVQTIPALSQVRLRGHIGKSCDDRLSDASFQGTVTVTLYDARTQQVVTSMINGHPIVDRYMVEGPILYKGAASVTNGVFSVQFIVPKDIKFDSLTAKISGFAHGDDNRTALGATREIQLSGSDVASVIDTTGPELGLYIGSRRFNSGDVVSKHSTVIVDIADPHGLNTSTASIGHGFIVWVDDSLDGAVDLAETFVSKQDDYTSGSSEHAIELPAGRHTLHVRAFDTFDNPTFGSVEFVAKKEDPYQLYSVSNSPNPVRDHTTFSFTQPGNAGSLIQTVLTIYTSDGRLVRTIRSDSRESVVRIDWDTRDDFDTPVSNGAYIFHVNAQNVDDHTSSQAEGMCIVTR
jgi:hypothetical protein